MGLLSFALFFQSCSMPAAAFLLGLWVIPRSSLTWLYWLVNQSPMDDRTTRPSSDALAGHSERHVCAVRIPHEPLLHRSLPGSGGGACGFRPPVPRHGYAINVG